jgi:hypothetical protein
MLKPLHVKISDEALEILEKVHRSSDIPKSRIVERGIRSVAKEFADIPKALKLLRAVEEAEDDLHEGRARPLEEVVREIRRKRRRKRVIAKQRSK